MFYCAFDEIFEKGFSIEHLRRQWQIQLHHCVKSVRIRSFSGLHFPALGLSTERYGVYQSKGEVVLVNMENMFQLEGVAIGGVSRFMAPQ